MKFDVETQTISLVGNDFGSDAYKWYSGAVASDGAIYVLPFCTQQILRIDPFLEFVTKLKADMEEHSEVPGFLFESAITKYRKAKVFQGRVHSYWYSMGRQRHRSVHGDRLVRE